jgi:hypothetical protein
LAAILAVETFAQAQSAAKIYSKGDGP